MAPRVLLVNPPIYDFTAYDYWLKPYGLLRVAGQLRDRAELQLFDYLDRQHPAMGPGRNDAWGRGPFRREAVAKPPALRTVPRQYQRFGLDRQHFRTLLQSHPPL